MKIETLSKWNLSEIILLVITFLLGMDINLYINLPTGNLSAAFWESPSTWIIRFHMIVGTAILAIAILLLINSFKLKSNIKSQSLVGFISVALAYLCGLAFLFLGTNDLFSYLMAVGFITAIISYVMIAVELKHKAN
jgi:hypothetical protein